MFHACITGAKEMFAEWVGGAASTVEGGEMGEGHNLGDQYSSGW